MDSVNFETADRVEIHELIARFNRAADTNAADDMAGTFIEEGVFEGLSSAARGRDAIRAFVRELATNPARVRSVNGLHWTTNVIIDFVGHDAATLTADMMMVVHGPTMPEISMMGRYNDEVVRTADGWRFKHRRVTRLAKPDA